MPAIWYAKYPKPFVWRSRIVCSTECSIKSAYSGSQSSFHPYKGTKLAVAPSAVIVDFRMPPVVAEAYRMSMSRTA